MYRSNRRFNIPPPPGIPRAYPRHLTPLPSRGGGNLIIRVVQGVGNLIPVWHLTVHGGHLVFQMYRGGGRGVSDYSSRGMGATSSQTVSHLLSRFDTLPQVSFGTSEIKMAANNSNRCLILRISQKNRGLWSIHKLFNLQKIWTTFFSLTGLKI